MQTLALIAAFGVVSLGLTILGMGGVAPIFSHPPLMALAVVVCLLLVASTFTSGNLSSGEREDRGNRWVLAVFGVLQLMVAYLPAYTDRIGFWTIDGDSIRWLGVVLFAAGGVLRMWPVFVLGRRFSGLVAIQPGHALVTDGIYGIIRNPSYLGFIINTLGWGLAFRSMVGVILAALHIPPIVARIRAEEAMLRMQFDGEFDRYSDRTYRLIPGLY
ncbi:MAG TPA: isoprenylcysteine carboxylmethyltransferase family protein [Candidatus Acidoferrales bacterium]|nr:isoprenylcysteine carboxylmethyltransferase family protein [Candidatus Acidoferrales bacterium]